MATKVILPKQGLQMTSGTITKWLIAEGEAVTEGKPLFEMETDKLTIIIDAQVSGTLLKIVRNEGEEVPITELIAVVGEPGEDISDILSEVTPVESASKDEPAEEKAETGTIAVDETPTATKAPGERTFITPRARTAAEKRGIDPQTLVGSGPDGLVIERDVLNAKEIKATPLARVIANKQGIDLSGVSGSGVGGKITKRDITASNGVSAVAEKKVIPVSGMRKAIADNMMNSLHSMAQANHRINVDMSQCAKIREAFKKSDKKLSYNDIIIFLLSRALLEYPIMNSTCDGENIYVSDTVNMGIAVAVDGGLIVPTLRSSENMTLSQLHDSAAELVSKARSGGLKKADYSDGTFTITNLGMYDIDSFTAVINPPQVGILAVGKIADTPVVVDGQIAIRPMCTLSLTYDHRVVDGAPAAQFLQRVKALIENPFFILA